MGDRCLNCDRAARAPKRAFCADCCAALKADSALCIRCCTAKAVLPKLSGHEAYCWECAPESYRPRTEQRRLL